jgi:hypothetical protein
MSALFQTVLSSFQSPWMLWGLLSVAAPIIIHLLQRRRVVQIPFSTLRFLKAISAKTTRRSRIENLLLLLLRCLIFALLILAAARPVISAKASRFLGGNVPRTVVLLVDNSLSMTYRASEQTRLELAKRQAMAILDDLKPDDEVAVIAVSDRADNLIAEPTVKHEMARQAVESIQPNEARTDFSAGFREARRIVLKSEKGIRLVFLITDNQETGWRFEANTVFNADWKSKSPKLVVVRTDELTSVNGSVKNIAFRSQFATGGSLVRGVATVENNSAGPLHDLLEVRLGEERVTQRPVDVDPNSAVDVQFEFTAPAVLSRALQGYGKLQGDNLPGDDRFYFALPVYKPPRVLVVQAQQGGEERLQSAFFLKKALGVGLDPATAASSVNVISAAELDDKPLEPYSAVFLADLPRFSDRAVVRLSRYLDSGRTVALFVGDQSGIDQLKRLDFLPAKPTKRYDLPANRIATRVTDPNHPLFASAWGSEMPFPPIPQQKMFDWDLDKDAKVLITMAGQYPFLIAGERGQGRVLVVNASADRTWGDLPLSPAFLPLVQQIARWSAEQVARQSSFHIGDPVPGTPSIPRDQTLTITLPDNTTVNLPAGERATLLTRADRTGFYTVTAATDGVVQQFVVNVPPDESRLRPITTPQLERLIPSDTARDFVTGLDNLKLWLVQNRGLTKLWPAILLLALLVFAVESLLANLMAASRSQAEETHIRTGRLNKRRLFQPFRDRGTETEAA